jgi:soluble lytic murein transglycosylase
VRRNPAQVTRLSQFKNKSQQEATVMAYGLKRLIWRDPKQALDTYKVAQQLLPFSDAQQQQIALKFSLALASKNHRQAHVWLDKVDDNVFNSNLIQWYITDTLRGQDWPATKAKLLQLPLSAQESSQWRYWYGRSLLATNAKEQGTQILNKLAQRRHYYGFLAASYMNKPANFQHKPLDIAEKEKLHILKNPAAKRTFELFELGRFHQARKEWNFWLSKLNKREKLVASKIAYELQWYDRAIFTLAKVGYLDDVNLRFPLGFEQEIKHYSHNQNISPAWAFAIARRESSFMSDANSSAGAKGLMQVMPATAKQLTRKKISKTFLLNADNNIKLGTKYLRRLLDRHSGNPVLATAAYNAGPYRVKSWLENSKSLPADVWIETIPFKETREYVKSVMAYQQIYLQKVGQPTALFDQIIDMNISN